MSHRHVGEARAVELIVDAVQVERARNFQAPLQPGRGRACSELRKQGIGQAS